MENDKFLLDNGMIEEIINSANEDVLERLYKKIAEKQIENIELKIKKDKEYIKSTINLENVETNQIKQIEYDKNNNIYILLNNGKLYMNKVCISSNVKELFLLDNFHIYSITTNNMILPLKDLEKWGDIDLYLYNEGIMYKKIISDLVYLVALNEDKEIKSCTSIPGIAIKHDNFINVDDIKFVKINEDLFEPYIIKNNQEMPLYIY